MLLLWGVLICCCTYIVCNYIGSWWLTLFVVSLRECDFFNGKMILGAYVNFVY